MSPGAGDKMGIRWGHPLATAGAHPPGMGRAAGLSWRSPLRPGHPPPYHPGRDLDAARVEHGLCSGGRNPAKNWARLTRLMAERSVEVTLLSEVPAGVPRQADGAL
jgi:hypothetical protein